MHVLIIPSWYPTHPDDINGSFFREQALALHKHGCKVGVIYPQMRSLRQWQSIFSSRYGLDSELDQGMTTIRYHGMNWYPRMKKMLNNSWCDKGIKLFNEYLKINGLPDIIHAHSIINGGVLAKNIAEIYNIPFVVTEHSSNFARGMITEYDYKMADLVVNKADLLLAVSNEFCKLMDEKFQSKKKWTYLPNMVNDSFLNEIIGEKELDKFTFINVAFSDKNKNQESILNAFKNEFNNNENIFLKICGDGPELENLKGLAKSLKISNQVEFTGALSREQVREKMALSNVFVLSSRYETFGVVVIEALALGLPVIATRCGGPESIVRKEDGILVPVGDVTTLGQAMRAVYENSKKYDKFQIRESCRERFSEKSITKKLIEIYGNIIDKMKPNEP